MNLQDFISQTLVQISNGIKDADEQLAVTGAVVNPRYVSGASSDKTNVYGYISEKREYLRAVHLVDFDVAAAKRVRYIFSVLTHTFA